MPLTIDSNDNAVNADVDDDPTFKSCKERRVCRVCTRTASKYVCPRCAIPYCSVACFRDHGESCTESFFKKQVQDEQRLRDKEDAEFRRAEMVQALDAQHSAAADGQRELELEEAESEAERAEQGLLDLLALLENTDLATDDGELARQAQSLLTVEQRAQLQHAMADGSLTKVVQAREPWTPYWERMDCASPNAVGNSKPSSPLIVEIRASENTPGPDTSAAAVADDGKDTRDGGWCTRQAMVSLDSALGSWRSPTLPLFDTIRPRAREPSRTLRFHVANIIACYAVTMRVFDGLRPFETDAALTHHVTIDGDDGSDDSTQACEAAALLMSLSGVLSRQACPAAMGSLFDDEAVRGLSQVAGARGRAGVMQQAFTDCARIMSDADMCTRALLDIWCLCRLVAEAHVVVSGEGSSSAKTPKGSRKRLLAAVHKAWFLLLWAKDDMTLEERQELAEAATYEAAVHLAAQKQEKQQQATRSREQGVADLLSATRVSSPDNTSIAPQKVLVELQADEQK